MTKYVNLTTKPKIDRDSGIPYYYQLKKFIKEQIESGKWKSGEQILPEIKICELLQISRTVVRQAYRELVNEGLLIKKKAKGTFIAKPKINENIVQSLVGFYEDMTERGFKVKNNILEKKKLPAEKKIIKRLNLQEGDEVVTIKRVRKISNEPIVLDRTYIPYKLCPDILSEDFSDKSLYTYLEEKCNLKIEGGRRYIEATIAGEEEAELLNITKGTPLLYIESIVYLKDGTPLEYYIALHRADKLRLVIELKRLKNFDQIINLSAKSGYSGIVVK